MGQPARAESAQPPLSGAPTGRTRRPQAASPGRALDRDDRDREHLTPLMEGPEARRLIAQLNRDARRIASHFGLCFRSIESERANVKRRFGVCYSDGSIRIRLRHATTGRALKYSSLVNTLCHELAHLRHFNHGPRFRAFYLQLLEWSRAQNIYRPGEQRSLSPGPPRLRSGWSPGSPRGIPERRPPAAARLPIQLDLFR